MMITTALGHAGNDILHVLIGLLCCLAICHICDSLKTGLRSKKHAQEDLDTTEELQPVERLTEPSDWVALSERKKFISMERKRAREGQR